MYNLKVKSGEYNIDLELRSNYTIISGDSATGKSFLYKKLQNADQTEDFILINYESVKAKGNYNAMVEIVKRSYKKYIIIDQADAIQRRDDTLMLAINQDKGNNMFIIIGRHPEIAYNISDLSIINITDKKITLEYEFDEPII